MRSGEIKREPSSAKLLIACLKTQENEVRSIISEYATIAWEHLGEIRLITVADRMRRITKQFLFLAADEAPQVIRHQVLADPVAFQKRIDELAPRSSAARIITIGRIKIQNNSTELDDYRSYTNVNTCRQFKDCLPAILKASGLDWLTKTTQQLQHYHHFSVDRPQVEQWLGQFQNLGKEWIGAGLLKLLDFWPSSRVCEELFTPVPDKAEKGKILAAEDWLNSYEYIVHNDTTEGASSVVISRFLRKQWDDRFDGRIKSVKQLAHLLLTPKTRILFLEDCIMTGQEAIDTLKAEEFRHILKSSRCDFKVAVATQWGIERVRAYARNEGLHSVSILEPLRGYIKNLTKEGGDALKWDKLFQAGVGSPICNDKHVNYGLNISSKTIFNHTARIALIRFCRIIGKQLMFHHFLKTGFPAAHANDEGERQSLGFGNLGLLFVFAHGVPDSTIPLIWLGGKISYEGQTLEWSPLLPKSSHFQH